MLHRPLLLLTLLLAASAVLVLLGLAVGSQGWEALLPQLEGENSLIIWQVRAPRSAGAWLTGGLLGLAGAIAQGLFRNPLADPYLLGSASGAALGVAAGWLLLHQQGWTAWGQFSIHSLAFAGAALAVLLALVLAQGAHSSLRLLLAGVVVGVVLGALRDALELRHPQVLQPMKAFGLGSTAGLDTAACLWMGLVLLLCLGTAWALARGLDALALGEASAASLGLPLGTMRHALLAVMAVATGMAVAQTGLIAFVGLAAGHMARGLSGGGHRQQLLLAAVLGGLLLLGADLLARGLWAPQELPVGVVSALLGGAYLLWLMHRQRLA